MPESERLEVLRQQRALMLEQLALLDRQIALEAGAQPAPPPATVAAPRRVPLPPISAAAEAEADALLAKLTAQPENQSKFSKTGCWLAFLGFMLLGGLVVGGAMRFFYR